MWSRQVKDDAGAVLVMVAVMLPVLIILVSFVANVGNWFEHKRHLQLQADAAALAAAGEYRSVCFDDRISIKANEYGGGTYNLPTEINTPAGLNTPGGRLHLLINSPTWWNQSSPSDPDFAGGANSSPCASQMIDVKMTENDLPWFFELANVPYINARARVQFQQLAQQQGALPLAVPDANPTNAAAIFVDDAGNVLAKKALVKRASTTLNGKSLTQWDNVGDDASVNVPSGGNVSVVFALSGTPSGMSLAGTTLTAICDGQPLVNCYGGPDSSWHGLQYIHGYSTAGTGSATTPIVRQVELVPTTIAGACADTSAGYFVLRKGCSLKARVKIDFGATPLGTVNLGLTGLNCKTNGANNMGCDMTQGTGADAGWWVTGTANNETPIVDTTDTGQLQVGLNFKVGSGTRMVIDNIARVYAADSDNDLSGPVEFAEVFEDTGVGLTPHANSLTTNTGNPHNLVVEIGVIQSLGNAQSVNDPITVLRVTGSQNQSVDCDPNVANLRDEIANGCAPQYKINTGVACPATATTLWASAQPWNCVAIQTGGSVGQVTQGFDARILQGGSCAEHPNNWASFPDFAADDTRVTSMFLTPFGTFSGSGNTVVPVQNFAYFYVTGWGRNGNGGTCAGDDKMPNGSSIPAGFVVGHFIKYVQTLNTGGSGTVCDPNGFGSCVAVLTK
jgi:hypothetical protein